MKTALQKFFSLVALVVVCASFGVSHAHAATLVEADITEDATWTSSGSPYVLKKQILVTAGVTLTIEPGTIVTGEGNFDQYYEQVGLNVRGGKITIQGIASDRVIMTGFALGLGAHAEATISHADLTLITSSASTAILDAVSIGSILVTGISTFTLDATSITGLTTYPTTVSSNSVLTMRHGSINNPYASVPQAISFLGANGTLQDVTVTSVTDGIKMSMSIGHFVRLENSLIRDCPGAGIRMVKDPAVQFDNNVLYLTSTELAGNGYGIQSNGKPTVILNGNSIHDNDMGVSYTGSAMLSFLATWWGDASGPYHSILNVNGKGNAISDGITISPWLNAEPFPAKVVIEPTPEPEPTPIPQPTPEPEPGPEPQPNPEPVPTPVPEPDEDPDGEQSDDGTGEVEPPVQEDVLVASGGPQLPSPKRILARTPVLVVPGLLGTELGSPAGKLWLDLDRALTDLADRFMDPLRFNPDLTPWNPSVSIEHIIGRKDSLGGLAAFDYTDSLMRELESRGYVRGIDVFEFPYDWRHGVSVDSVRQLADRISFIRMQTGSDTVDVVAHSMGGLIVKKYVKELGYHSGIGKAIFVGVPDIGAPKVLKTLIQGDTFGIPFLADAEIRRIVQNMPALYDLAPSSAYYAIAGSYFGSIRQGLGRSVTQFTKVETERRLITSYDANSAAIARSNEMHDGILDTYDMRTAGVDLYSIIGCRAGTFGGIAEIRMPEALGGATIGFDNLTEVSGDGTVPVVSSVHLPVDSGHRFFSLRADHARMLGQEGVRQQIAAILSGDTTVATEGFMTQDSTRCGLNGHLLSVRAPLSVTVSDVVGRKGSAIPNADMLEFDAVTFAYLPSGEGESYEITLEGTGKGDFWVTDSVIKEGVVVSTREFKESRQVIPGTKARLILGEPSKILFEDASTTEDREDDTEPAVFGVLPQLPPSGPDITHPDSQPSHEDTSVLPVDTQVGIQATVAQSGTSRLRFGFMLGMTILFTVLAILGRALYARATD